MEEGKCPKCGCNNLDYGVLEIGDNSVYYPWNCPDCGASGKEWYDLVFSEQKCENKEEERLEIGNLIGFGMFIDDIELSDWRDEKAKEGKKYFKVTAVDDDYFWVENCPYAINYEEAWFLKK